MSEQAAAQHEDTKLSTVDEVVSYLADAGWIAKRSTVFLHCKQGKLLPKDDGQYHKKDIDRYAKTWLKQQSTRKKVRDLEDELQRKVLQSELSIKEEELKRRRRQNEIDDGKYIERKRMEEELAGRAGILEAGLKHWVQSRVADWIRIAGGDLKKAGELINSMIRDLDEHINSYAQAREFDAVIGGEDETEEEVSHEQVD